jgi:hypothetical protein
MEEDSTTHPDEGTIHAWLDDALDAATAAGIAEHVRTCPACAERVAEARGLIAGASRIVASLDDVPPGARAGWAQSAPERGAAAPAAASARPEGSLWRWLHVTPARAAIAATVLVALGITMTRTRTGPDDVRVAARSGALSPRVAMSDSASPAEASAPTAARDPLLDSALKRNIAIAQPRRTMEAVSGPRIPTPEPGPPTIGLAAVDTTAASRVAVARREVQAEREQRAVVADKSRVRGAVGAAADASSGAAEANLSGRVAAIAATPPMMAQSRAVAGAVCYRLESSSPGATWGGEALPLVVSADSAARSGRTPAQVLTAAGRPTSIRALFRRGGADSLTLMLSRIGYSGTIALGPDLGGRTGIASSAPSAMELESVVVTGYSTGERDSATTGGARKPTATANTATRAPSGAPAPAPAAPAVSAAKRAESSAQPSATNASRVTMRVVSCPSR